MKAVWRYFFSDSEEDSDSSIAAKMSSSSSRLTGSNYSSYPGQSKRTSITSSGRGNNSVKGLQPSTPNGKQHGKPGHHQHHQQPQQHNQQQTSQHYYNQEQVQFMQQLQNQLHHQQQVCLKQKSTIQQLQVERDELNKKLSTQISSASTTNSKLFELNINFPDTEEICSMYFDLMMSERMEMVEEAFKQNLLLSGQPGKKMTKEDGVWWEREISHWICCIYEIATKYHERMFDERVQQTLCFDVNFVDVISCADVDKKQYEETCQVMLSSAYAFHRKLIAASISDPAIDSQSALGRIQSQVTKHVKKYLPGLVESNKEYSPIERFLDNPIFESFLSKLLRLFHIMYVAKQRVTFPENPYNSSDYLENVMFTPNAQKAISFYAYQGLVCNGKLVCKAHKVSLSPFKQQKN